jgi:alpha-tubulin suppressor-like RCC1 family protein
VISSAARKAVRTLNRSLLRLMTLAVFGAWASAAYAFIPFTGASAVVTGSNSSHTCALVGGSLKCWGDNSGGQLGDGTMNDSLTPIQVTGLTAGVTAAATGASHTCAVVSGGVKCWGTNSSGQLGDSTNFQRSTPVQVTGLTSGVSTVVAGSAHTCALTTGGGVKCWGANSNGQLGNGGTGQQTAPVNVTGLTSGVVAIAAGQFYTCAVTSAGLVKCWGANGAGQLGDNSISQRLTPVTVANIASGATSVDAGLSHTCALVSGGVKCWGQNVNGQLGDGTQSQQLTPVDVVGLTSGVSAITLGAAYSCALTTANGIKCWGSNQHAEIGDGTLVTPRLTAVDVLGLTSGVSAVSAGNKHTCALVGGAVQCWGDDSTGQLGDFATTQRLTPYPVTGQPNVKSASAGGLHTCAVVGIGAVKCWGANDNGQLGDNSIVQRQTAVDVVGLSSGVVSVVTGATHSCALTTSGGVTCWGGNSNGQLGDGTNTQRLTPVNVTGLSSGVRAIAAGDNHTCALTNAGGVKCWGQNTTGQIGDGTQTDRWTPVNVTGLASGVIAVDAGAAHTCALTTGNGVKCWGWNGFGQIGDNSMSERDTAVDVVGLSSGVSAIAVGQYHSCALAGGGVKCWGWNSYGQLGDNTVAQRLTPVPVVGLASGVTGIAGGNGHTCAVTAANAVKCWGDDTYGQLGDGNTGTQSPTPVAVPGASGASIVIAGGMHTCARISGGLACWGLNSNGQLGDSTVNQQSTPVDVVGIAALHSVAGGATHTCSLTVGGGARCWGGNTAGQLGDGTILTRVTPTLPSGLATGATMVSAGSNHSCAIVAGGGQCWGDNTFGQIGDNTQFQRLTPVSVGGISGLTAISASAAGGHTCAIASGGAWCWGQNLSGELGDGTISQRLAPVPVIGLASGVTAIATGQYHTCAIASGGGLKCWGYNQNGQIGDNTQTQRPSPVDVSGLTSGVAAVATGMSHSCAVTASGSAMCWGLNSSGQLGDGTVNQRLTPVAVSGLGSGVASITAGASHTCALTAAGGVKCWGLNTFGQLGDGTTTVRLAPVDVSGLTSGVLAISAGQNHTCALILNVGVKCWGQNMEGELGDGTAGSRPFPGNVLIVGPAVQLAITSVNNGNPVAVSTGFNVVIESRDAGDTPANVAASTAISLGLVGPGSLGGTTTCTLAAATKNCTVTGATINTSQVGALLSASRTSGDVLTAGLSNPFDVIATPPGAPTGITAVQVQGGIKVTFTAPASTGGSPITGYTVTCNPGAITGSGTASPIVVSGLVNNTPYTCNVRATNAIGSGAVSSPSGTVFYTVAQRTFVASSGDDTSSLCAATAPCRTLATALVKTLPGGEVVILDSAPYDVVTVTMPVTILAAGGNFAGISAQPGQSAITVAAGPSDNVFLRGLVITSEGGSNGILFSSGAALYLENMIVRGYNQPGQVDVNFAPTGAAKLSIKDSRIQSGTTGLLIANGGPDVGVVVDNVRFENNGTGIKAIANGQLTVRNSIVSSGTQDGINLAAANALPLTVTLDRLLVSGNALAGITSGGSLPVYTTVSRSTLRGNGGTGIFVSGGGVPSETRVTQSAVVRNVTGVGAGAGGSLLSRGDNTVEANNADGSFSGTYSGK